jgi:hypothetical protein
MTKYSCARCGSEDIRQQVSVMLDPNDPPVLVDLSSVYWDDYFYCESCEDGVQVIEHEEGGTPQA